MPNHQQQIQLARRPKGVPVHDDFRFETIAVPEPKDGEVLVKTSYVSVDPYMRGRMQDTKSYVEPFALDEAITGGVIAEVLTDGDKLKKGDVVIGNLVWQEYSAVNESALRKLDTDIAPAQAYLGILGMTGLTAYFGLLDIGRPKKGETVVVSGAAGAVGSTVGQIAKIKGARVVGIAGSDEKIAYLKEELQFDEAINYKTADDIQKALEQACPDGVDVYFDNVGGPISDAVINLLNEFARIPVCGAISSYNTESEEEDMGPRVQPKLIKTKALMQGFIVSDYADRFSEGAKQLAEWLKDGKLHYEETITEGFNNIPDAFLGLFKGENKGKQIIKVSDLS
ncbi:NADP-dependent oxidoreductase [Bacillus amyloliquefaciens]|uniref:NADP-dependent oxidoreductase n=1 Tax=Bacillus amyloliquefaciens TaxID=1390 RepID=UPI00158003C4|nr:NADP-dependent oxidoreductase [Bacillus amyloliquefaciens]NUI23598.1 NADP-dependent oxidoreductase [Bacillus amyloliquefaciens]NUI32585.1 NADP-dependent oxidoreductase [Bacillus amyloliquefaciens]NUI36291.1 NADP-dependent oxidoreductase [Bacillus amyloliquefaciens]NUI69959.1 NADP-dependent oxidoreductase [Bacillus amyloliquefaciens]NUI73556.1 NADP-dependent oxidoreductase [Bacillus amyloliquefaciens]